MGLRPELGPGSSSGLFSWGAPSCLLQHPQPRTRPPGCGEVTCRVGKVGGQVIEI